MEKPPLLMKQDILENKTKFEKVAIENFGNWNKSLQTGDPQQVANLYAKDATFLPTVSANFVEGQNGPEKEPKLEQLATENFSRWNDLLQTGDPEQVARLYAEDATFLPTASNDFKKGQNGAKEYFSHFLEKIPEGKITESVIQTIDEQHYLQSGKYDFEVGPQDNRTTLHARFTFLWQKNEQGNWEIAHHHSSPLPVVSNDFEKGENEVEKYFSHFLEKIPEGKITESVIQTIDEQHYLQSGKYDFEVGPQDNRTTLHARFTFLWQKNEQGDWEISHHHSSLNPEE